jgi:hypothetical protein
MNLKKDIGPGIHSTSLPCDYESKIEEAKTSEECEPEFPSRLDFFEIRGGADSFQGIQAFDGNLLLIPSSSAGQDAFYENMRLVDVKTGKV